MEKRILIAFLLSFVVLTAWSAINPPPKPKTISTQVVDNKQVVTEAAVAVPASSSLSVAQKLDIKEEIVSIENSKIKVEFSNVGGTIKTITIKEFNYSLPVTGIYSVAQFDQAVFVLKSNSGKAVSYVYQSGQSRIEKTFALSDDDYLIQANVQTEGLSNLEIGAYKADASLIDEKTLKSPQRSLFEYSIGLLNKIVRKDNAAEFHEKENRSENAEVSWVGFRNQYFCMLIKPDYKTEKFSVVVADKKNLKININPVSTDKSNYSATIYTGPQSLKLLASYKSNFEQILVFSNHGILDIFAKMIYFFVHFLQGIFKNWGVSIMVLGVTLYGITYPLTAKSMSSMRKMQLLQPKMKALQDKYKTDPQRLNKEMMELYKENKVNPFGGCLPMLLQMPIFYGLYQVLWRSESFKGAEFLWIKDLSEPDRLATMPFSLPFLGNEFNILPLAMAATMFFQQKFTSKGMVITDESQLMQQKMMLVLMPVMMFFIFYHFASGLSLYFTVFYSLSTLTAWKMSKVNGLAK